MYFCSSSDCVGVLVMFNFMFLWFDSICLQFVVDLCFFVIKGQVVGMTKGALRIDNLPDRRRSCGSAFAICWGMKITSLSLQNAP